MDEKNEAVGKASSHKKPVGWLHINFREETKLSNVERNKYRFMNVTSEIS